MTVHIVNMVTQIHSAAFANVYAVVMAADSCILELHFAVGGFRAAGTVSLR
jgi:hypothetical protein